MTKPRDVPNIDILSREEWWKGKSWGRDPYRRYVEVQKEIYASSHDALEWRIANLDNVTPVTPSPVPYLTTYAELFAGGGGWGIGARLADADLTPLWGIEVAPHVTAALHHNNKQFSSHRAIQSDCRLVDPAILTAPDALFCSPPCQAFSYGRTNSSPHPDRSVGIDILRYLERLHVPPTFVAVENVVDYMGTNIFQTIAAYMERLGYFTRDFITDAAFYGVPQTRRRGFLLADLRRPPRLPVVTTPKPVGFLQTALPWLNSDFERNLPQWMLRYNPERNQRKLFFQFAVVTSRKKIRVDRVLYKELVHLPDVTHVMMQNTRPQRYPALRANVSPAPTIVAHYGKQKLYVLHETGRSWELPVEAAAAFQTLPTDFATGAGNQDNRGEVVGNAVPPLLAKAIVLANL